MRQQIHSQVSWDGLPHHKTLNPTAKAAYFAEGEELYVQQAATASRLIYCKNFAIAWASQCSVLTSAPHRQLVAQLAELPIEPTH